MLTHLSGKEFSMAQASFRWENKSSNLFKLVSSEEENNQCKSKL